MMQEVKCQGYKAEPDIEATLLTSRSSRIISHLLLGLQETGVEITVEGNSHNSLGGTDLRLFPLSSPMNKNPFEPVGPSPGR